MTCQHIQSAISETVYGRMQSSNFDDGVRRHLSECLGCRRHADEMSGLVALVGGLPRVTAPADFDFKLRARIARAKAERRETRGMAAFFGRSFSFAQAGLALAAVALVAGLTTYQFLPGQPARVVAPVETASVNHQDAPARTAPAVPQLSSAPMGRAQVESVSARTAAVKPRRVSVAPAELTPVRSVPTLRAEEVAPQVVAKNTILIKGARGKTVQMVVVPDVPETTYGAQAVSFRPAQPAPGTSGEIAAAVIY